MKIFQIKEICDCGKKVTDHHFLCNKCWGKKYSNSQRIKERIKLYEFLLKVAKNKIQLENKIKQLKKSNKFK